METALEEKRKRKLKTEKRNRNRPLAHAEEKIREERWVKMGGELKGN